MSIPTSRDAQETLVYTVLLASFYSYLKVHSYAFNISIVCPSLMVTIAFFHSRASTGRGAVPRRRIHLGLPGIRITFTLTTSTLKRLSTARRISILLAFNATLKVYWLRSCN